MAQSFEVRSSLNICRRWIGIRTGIGPFRILVYGTGHLGSGTQVLRIQLCFSGNKRKAIKELKQWRKIFIWKLCHVCIIEPVIANFTGLLNNAEGRHDINVSIILNTSWNQINVLGALTELFCPAPSSSQWSFFWEEQQEVVEPVENRV